MWEMSPPHSFCSGGEAVPGLRAWPGFSVGHGPRFFERRHIHLGCLGSSMGELGAAFQFPHPVRKGSLTDTVRPTKYRGLPRLKRGIRSGKATLVAHLATMIARMKTIGYARTFVPVTRPQRCNSTRCAPPAARRIFEDFAGGTGRVRPGLASAIAAVGAGDAPVVWRLDRLGRSLRHLLEIVEALRDRAVVLHR